jgi:hypothetical protein
MSLESSSKGERELPSGGVARKVRERIWDNLPSVIRAGRGFKILPDNGAKMLSHNCSLGKSQPNHKGGILVTLGGLRWKV